MEMKWNKGADVRVRHEGKIWDAKVEGHIPPPNDLGYVKEKYRLFLPEYMGGRGVLITAEQGDVMPSRELSERQWEPGDRFLHNGRQGVIVGSPEPIWNGKEMAAPKNSYSVAFDDKVADPNSPSPRDRSRTENLHAGLMEPVMNLDIEVKESTFEMEAEKRFGSIDEPRKKTADEALEARLRKKIDVEPEYEPGDVVKYAGGTAVIESINHDNTEVSLRGSGGNVVRKISEIELDITQTLALRERENRDQSISDMERGLDNDNFRGY